MCGRGGGAILVQERGKRAERKGRGKGLKKVRFERRRKVRGGEGERRFIQNNRT